MKTRPLVLGTLALLSLAGAAPAHAETWSPSQLSHQIGSLYGGWWRATIDFSYCPLGTCTGGPFTTYGPSVNVPPGDSIAVTGFGATGHNGLTQRWKVEVYDNLYGDVLASKSLAQPYQEGYSGFTHQVMLPFSTRYPNSNVQVRTRDWGGGTLDQCSVHILTEPNDKIADVNPVTNQSHETGFQMPHPTEPVWEVSQGTCQYPPCASQFMSYGPYWNLPFSGVRYFIALFKLGVVDGYTYGTSDIATIDVMANDNGTWRILATRNLKRGDFGGSWVPTGLPLKFLSGPGLTQYQFRVRWHGVGTMVQYRTKIYDPHNSACLTL